MNSKPSNLELEISFESAKRMFFIELGQTTSGYVFGSAATNAWTSARSDLDLIIFLDLSKFSLICSQIQKWKLLNLPPLDGFLCFIDSPDLMALRIDDLYDGSFDEGRPLINRILPPDLWKIQFQSQLLFGSTNCLSLLPKLDQQNLKEWAISNRDS